MKKKILVICLTILTILFSLIISIKLFYTNKQNNNMVISYSDVGIPQNNYIAVSDGKQYSYLNLTTLELIDELKYPIIDTMKPDDTINLSEFVFIDGLAPITNERGYLGLINTDGKIIIQPKYSTIKVLSKDLILVYENGNYYFIDSNEKPLFDISFQSVELLEGTSEIFIINQDDKYGIMNDQGKIILECQYNQILKQTDHNNHYIFQATIGENIENYYYSNSTIRKIEDAKNMNIFNLDNQYIYYTDSDGLFYLYDLSNNQMKQFTHKYVIMGTFNNGLALAINEDMKVGFIDENEKVVIPFKYDSEFTSNFSSTNYAVVAQDNLVGVIDQDGKEILPIKYYGVTILDEQYFLVFDQNNQSSIIDTNQKKVTTKEYSSISTIENFPYLLTKDTNQLYGIINYQGKEIIPNQYKAITVYKDYFLLQSKDNEYIIKKID